MNDRETDPLYHYTDAAGLLGILKPSSWDLGDWPEFEEQFVGAAQLHASDVRYMNDSQELKFGARFFVARLTSAAGDPSLPVNVQQICQSLATIFGSDDLFGWNLRCFAACFCEHGDLLSQWRGYAGGAGGYAIGFNRDAVANHSWAMHHDNLMGITADKAHLSPVRYGPTEAKAVADEFIDEVRNPDQVMALMIQGAKSPTRTGLWWVAAHALRAIVSVKDDGFQEEHEWRLHYLDSELKNPVKIRSGRPGIVPYLNMAVNRKTPDQESIPPTVEKLVVGPGHNQLGQIAAARELLKASGHNPDIVMPSKVSFTG